MVRCHCGDEGRSNEWIHRQPGIDVVSATRSVTDIEFARENRLRLGMRRHFLEMDDGGWIAHMEGSQVGRQSAGENCIADETKSDSTNFTSK